MNDKIIILFVTIVIIVGINLYHDNSQAKYQEDYEINIEDEDFIINIDDNVIYNYNSSFILHNETDRYNISVNGTWVNSTSINYIDLV